MNWYFYAQQGKGDWKAILSSDREAYIEEHKPEFATVLDVNQVWGRNDKRPVDLALRGPLYIDWDGDGDLNDVLDSVKRFMNKLEAIDFDLDQASWWLSGNKGVHCIIPVECFIPEKDIKRFMSQGHPYLPTIYRTMVSDETLITSHMDMRVYTSGKGRMWRTAGLPRTLKDGRTTYKVPVRPSELRKLDDDSYWDTVAEPREPIYPKAPDRNMALSVMFARAATKVQDLLKAREKNFKNEVKFDDWQGKMPPTIEAVFNGEFVQPNLDLNAIKMQICIAGVAVGYKKLSDEDRFIEAIQGFINSRVGTPGATHQTASSIEAAMRNCFRSVAENSCYAYTPMGFASILKAEHKNNLDLFGKQSSETDVNSRIQKDLADQVDGWTADDLGVIHVKKDEVKSYGNYSWKPGSLMKIADSTGRIQAHSVVPLVLGKEGPRTILSTSTQLNSLQMCKHILEVGGHLESIGNQTLSKIRLAWCKFAGADIATAPTAEAVPLEGIYVQVRTEDDLSDELDYDNMLNLYWVEASSVIPSQKNMGPLENGSDIPAPQYMDIANPDGRYGTDLSKCKYTLGNTKTPTKDTVEALLELNGNFFSIALMLGWFTACLLKHPLYKMKMIKNFPIMQVYGDAGCGKTTTMNLMLKMFVWSEDFKVNSAGEGLTPAAIRMMATGTASIPLVIDEVKAQNLGKGNWIHTFRQTLQNMYTLGGQLRKAGGRGEGTHHNGLVDDPMYAPVAFMGETLETSQVSLMERTAAAGFHKADKTGREGYAAHLNRNSRVVSILGRTLVHEVLEGSMKELVELYKDSSEKCYQSIYSGQNDRITENAAIILTGFRFFSKVIEKYYPTAFTEKLESMQHALLDVSRWSTEVPSEVIRLLKFFSQASHEQEFSRTRAVKGHHYRYEAGFTPEGHNTNYLIISCDRMYFLYRERMRTIDENPVFTSSEEMYHALKNSILVVDALADSELGPNCVKIEASKLTAENIQLFRS